jgi:hypothetical protein
VASIVADELPEVRYGQNEQNRDADRVDQQDPVLAASEIVGVFGDLCEQQQGDEPQQYAENR